MEKPVSNVFLKGANLYLVGMMGAGKSTVGKRLASRLGYRFLDTDSLIEQTAGQRISQIFAECGEAVFRDLETQVLGQVATYGRLVVATGGGVVLRSQNWSYLQQGVVIWLDASLEQLQQRLEKDRTRPLLQVPDWQQRLATLLRQRQDRYAQADLHIQQTPTETPDAIAARILDTLPKIVKSTPKPVPKSP
jgi:shikimate kinase